MTVYVATTDIRHGEPDGGVTTFAQGDVVEGLEDHVLQDLYFAGALTVEGSADDPNTFPTADVEYVTSPAMVAHSLEAQARLAQAPGGTQHEHFKNSLTQPQESAPENPLALLGKEDASVSTLRPGDEQTRAPQGPVSQQAQQPKENPATPAEPQAAVKTGASSSDAAPKAPKASTSKADKE